MADIQSPNGTLKPLEIIAEAWATLRKDWRLYLRWAVAPLLFFIVEFIWICFSSARSFKFFMQAAQLQQQISTLPQQEQIYQIQQLQQVFPFSSFMAMPLVYLLGILIGICYSIRVYRFVILGDMPNGNLFAQIFSKRPWLYLWKSILLGLKWWLLTAAFMIAGFIVMALLGAMMRASGAPAGVIVGILVPVDITIVCLALASGFILIAEQFALIGPDVAVDAPASLSRLKRLAKQHRWRIFLTFAVISLVPILVHIVLVVSVQMNLMSAFRASGMGSAGGSNPAATYQAIAIFWQEHGASLITMYGLLLLLWLAWAAMSLFVRAVIYKRLCPTWPAEETTATQEPVRFAPGLSSK